MKFSKTISGIFIVLQLLSMDKIIAMKGAQEKSLQDTPSVATATTTSNSTPEEWHAVVDDDAKGLLEKVQYLQQIKNEAIEESPQFYSVLEKIKKDFVREMGEDELSKNEESALQKSLEELVGLSFNQLHLTVLPSGQTFAHHWILAQDQKGRDEAMLALTNAVIENTSISLEDYIARIKSLNHAYKAVKELLSNKARQTFLIKIGHIQDKIIQHQTATAAQTPVPTKSMQGKNSRVYHKE